MSSYKNAAGRNWDRPRRRHRSVRLQQDGATSGARQPSAVWYPLRDLKGAAGRNWPHRAPRRRASRLRPAHEANEPVYPLRERGGGDHDQEYAFARPSVDQPFPFNLREYARLLALKSRLAEDRR